jgi:hypothetical protein
MLMLNYLPGLILSEGASDGGGKDEVLLVANNIGSRDLPEYYTSSSRLWSSQLMVLKSAAYI